MFLLKLRRKIALLTLLFLIFVVACSDDDSPTSPVNPDADPLLVGTWKLTTITVDGLNLTPETAGYYDISTLTSGQAITVWLAELIEGTEDDFEVDDDTGTWSTSGGLLYVAFGTGLDTLSYTASASSFSISIEEDGEDYTLTYTQSDDPTDVVGTWDLAQVTVDGVDLTPEEAEFDLTLVIAANHTLSETFTEQGIPETVSGAWTAIGSSLFIIDEDGPFGMTYSVSGSTMTFTFPEGSEFSAMELTKQ
ncbi:lipocalin family protein [candidate division KSB1 bacterium]